MRREFVLVAMVSIALTVVPAATAGKPAREIIPAPGDMSFTDQCDFPVLAHIEGGEIDTTFFDKAGDPVKLHGVFPGQTLTVTNLDTGKSITVTDAGSFKARAARDGSVRISITGHGPLPSFITAKPGFWYLSGGHVTFSVDEDDNPTSIESTGNLINLCGRLAA